MVLRQITHHRSRDVRQRRRISQTDGCQNVLRTVTTSANRTTRSASSVQVDRPNRVVRAKDRRVDESQTQ